MKKWCVIPECHNFLSERSNNCNAFLDIGVCPTRKYVMGLLRQIAKLLSNQTGKDMRDVEKAENKIKTLLTPQTDSGDEERRLLREEYEDRMKGE